MADPEGEYSLQDGEWLDGDLVVPAGLVCEPAGTYDPVRRFDQHPVWQKAREYRKALYSVAKRLPAVEAFNLRPQILKVAVSITANFAEGFGRYSFQENIQFCRVSRGSLNEALDYLYTCLDEHYIVEDEFQRLYRERRELERGLNGYIGFLQQQAERSRKSG